MTPQPIQPGLLVLHGNRAELLRDALFEWVQRQPLAPLEEEVFLVQSNGVAEWLKMALAERLGVCAATRVELPARFMWRAFRQALGRDAVPGISPLDKSVLAWRLMARLPELLDRPDFAPLARFLAGDDIVRRLQLAQRLADLFDQYQVYRSDWLDAWAAGRDVLSGPGAPERPVPVDQAWQPALWREVLALLSPGERHGIRPQLHRRFVDLLNGDGDTAARLPRRVVLFGMSHVPMQTMEALAALATRSQVLLAVPNPCQYHWADILQGRDLLRFAARRHPLRGGRDLAAVPLEDMHLHGHPLLAAWGRQGGDFIRQLDAFDDAAERARFEIPRVDLFDESDGDTLLQQVQARVRDLVPIAEHPPVAARRDDRSVVFHVAHGAQREVEVLHDQLLALLADPRDTDGTRDRPLHPRDIVVMVPDVETFAPAIRAVFGQYGRNDPRHIPFDIADVRERGTNPLIVATDWLMRLPIERCRLNDVRDLLDVPAIAARFGITEADLPRLTAWLAGAGVRWGLDTAQRADLGLAACGEQNTWLFGLRRMLLGYATGFAGGEFDGIEPYAEVGGLEATLAGSLAALVDALQAWWRAAVVRAEPAVWGERLRGLLAAVVKPADERDRVTVAALDDALRRWLEACDIAGFAEPVPLAAVREAWLGGVDEAGVGSRFLGGGVTFCTLMPMRSIPFEVVCLLGMNDGDYPRATTRSDFDLMGLRGLARPGDRSRRDDDRQLMLEAVLSARRVLYVSWTGRNARDNSVRPPSVLVSQLRDYLAAGWTGDVLADRTTEHPLQPFSRRYFEGAELFTYAREWQAAHGDRADDVAFAVVPPDTSAPIGVRELARFLQQPVREFFARRLQVAFHDADEAPEDEETFSVDGLLEYQLVAALVADAAGGDVAGDLDARVEALRRTGALPIGAPGRQQQDRLVATVAPMLASWQAQCAAFPDAAPKRPLHHVHAGVVLDDWADGLRTDGGRTVWLDLVPGRLLTRRQLRADRLVVPWVRALVAGATGDAVDGVIVARDATVTVRAVGGDEARARLDELMAVWHEGVASPLPVAAKTALAWGLDPAKAPAVYDGEQTPGEGTDPCLARLWPDFESLAADPRFEALAEQLYGPVLQWIATSVSVTPHADAAGASDE